MTDLRALALQIAEEEGLDPELALKVIAAESNWDPEAVSDAGAQGLMQLMPGTAKELGVEDAFDPEQNLRGGMRYLRDQLDQFGTVPLALAAYNAGPGSVQKYGGIPPYAETQNYVAKITGGHTVSTDQISGGPAYPGGTIQPVSAGGQPQMPPSYDYDAADQQAEALALKKLEAIRRGLQQPSPDWGDALLGAGIGILNAGGGPGAGNWMAGGFQGAVEGMQPDVVDPAMVELQLDVIESEARIAERRSRRKWFESLRPQERLKARAALGDKVAQVELDFRNPGKVMEFDGVPYHYKDGQLTPIPIPGMGAGGPPQIDPKDVVTWTNTIADNFRQEAKPLEAGLRYYQDVRGYNPGTMDAAQQMSLIVSFAKLADPNSAVQEGEVDVIRQAGQTMPWITSLWKQAKGGTLSPEQQRMYLADIEQKAQRRAEEYNALYGRYAGQFGAVGLPNPEIYLGRPFSFQPPGGPAKGTDLGGGFTVN